MAQKNRVNLPYIDYLLQAFRENNELVEAGFGRHIHWGYWQQPSRETPSTQEFAEAAERLTGQVCAAAGIENGQTVLDVGCGFGGTLAHLNENYRGMNLLGLNLDERQLARAQKAIHALGDNQISFYQGDACLLPFQNETFDVVLAVECIFHFPDRNRFFCEAARIIKPGGSLAITDFVPVKILLPFARTAASGPFKTGFYGECHVQCTKERYRQLAEGNGFSIMVEEDITQNTLPTYIFLRKSDTRKGIFSVSAVVGTLSGEILSRLNLLQYMVYGFRKIR